MVETHQGILFVNPGSPTLPNQLRKLGTVGILELTSELRSARIVDLAALDGCEYGQCRRWNLAQVLRSS